MLDSNDGKLTDESQFIGFGLYVCVRVFFVLLFINFVISMLYLLRGAKEACWTHNLKIDGSIPSGSTTVYESMFYTS